MTKLLLFDVDGTLLSCGGAGNRAMTKAGQIMFGPHFTLGNINLAGNLDPLIYNEAVHTNNISDADSRHDEFRDQYLIELEKEINANGYKMKLMPGVVNLLKILHHIDHISLGLVTGNYADGAHQKLKGVEIDTAWFKYNGFGDEGKVRADLVSLAIRRYHNHNHNNSTLRNDNGATLRNQDVIVIGDTPYDVACAHANNCTSFAVATGGYSFDVLCETGADVVVNDLTDTDALFELIEN